MYASATVWPRVRALPRRAWRAALAGLGRGITNYAAALTFYALLSLSPALIIVVALLSALGQTSATQLIVTIVEQLAPPDAVDAIREPVARIVAASSGAAAIVSLGVVIALWSASGYIAAFVWAVEPISPVEKAPSFLRGLLSRLLFAVVILLLLALMGAAVVVGGPLARLVADAVGLGDATVTAYRILRWPLLFAAATLLFFVLYVASPGVRQRGLLAALPGALLGVGVWLVASALFNLYVTSLGRYGATYGTLAGLVVFLLWVWILNLCLLLGAEFNAQTGDRGRIVTRAAGIASR